MITQNCILGLQAFLLCQCQLSLKQATGQNSRNIPGPSPMKMTFYNTKSKIRYRKMIKGGKALRDKRGKVHKAADFQDVRARIGKIHADKKWFRATRLIEQAELEKISEVSLSPYEILLKRGKVPFDLTKDTKKRTPKTDFQKVFGKKATRIKPKIEAKTIEEMASARIYPENTECKELSGAECHRKGNIHASGDSRSEISNIWNVRGQTRRIWNELYKVIDCSDVIVHVLDARDPEGTMCLSIEKYTKERPTSKHLIYLLNKVDLVPTGVTAKWLKILSSKSPALAYHSNSLSNFYGRENLISLIKQYGKLKGKDISVGFVGYPNIGKSSVINTLRNKAVCSVAPVPGQTKVYQYIALTKKIYLIDSPGVVPTSTREEAVLKGAMRIENLEDPEYFFELVYKKAEASINKVYGIESASTEDFLEKYCRKYGKIGKGGVLNTSIASKVLLHDWIRGKIPFYVGPPESSE